MSIVRHEEAPSTQLAIQPDQTSFSPAQVAALRQIGVEKATDGDLEVFFHVAKRSGLDPFARQIHMVGRNVRDDNDRWVTKYTIQTGIDGYRLIGRRAANAAGEKIRLDPPQWCDRNGAWHDVWSNEWGTPLAARVTIYRDGEPFPAVALFDEYAQTRKNGTLTQMWSQRPAGQIAKCAEALAWRQAFPQDLAGIYTDEEMAQADNHRPLNAGAAPAQQPTGLAAALQTSNQASDASTPGAPTPVEATVVAEADDSAGRTSSAGEDDGGGSPASSPLLNTRSALAKQMFKAMNDAGITEKADRLALCSEVTGRDITSSNDLTEDEARDIIAFLPEQGNVAEA